MAPKQSMIDNLQFKSLMHQDRKCISYLTEKVVDCPQKTNCLFVILQKFFLFVDLKNYMQLQVLQV